jgi:hypothetical protein
MILREGSAFIDLCRLQDGDTSIWRYACRDTCWIPTPKALQILIEAGVDVAEVDEGGNNCLFNCVLMAQQPSKSAELEALRFLLTVFDDIFARDSTGWSLFDYMVNRELASGKHGSYRRDLWYCALYRSKLCHRFSIPPPPLRIRFTSTYTICHYRALLYLDSWNFQYGVPNHQKFQNHHLVCQSALTAEEREQAPSYHEWNAADLSMMEQRARVANSSSSRIYVEEMLSAEGSSCESSDEWETESASDEDSDG